MLSIQRKWFPSAALAALATFSFAGPSNDPILGDWTGKFTGTSISGPVGSEDYAVDNEVIDVTYGASSFATWQTIVGPWKKHSGKYSINVSKGMHDALQSSDPAANIHVKYRIKKVKLVGPLQAGDVKLDVKVEEGGTAAVYKIAGSFAAARP